MAAVVGVISWCLGMGGDQASAIEGGAKAYGRDPLARATVAVRALDVEDGSQLGLSHCSGVLVASNLVITAGHCIPESVNLAGLGVFLYEGAEPVGRAIRVAAIIRRAEPSGVRVIKPNDVDATIRQLSSDFAVLRLAHPVVGHKPLALADTAGVIPSSFRLAGVGISGRTAGTLRTTGLKTALALTQPRLALAKVPGGRVCLGDSGGPAVVTGPTGALALWGIATAVITPAGPCGSIVVVTPVDLGG